MAAWGKLVRTGGVDIEINIPSTILLFSKTSFVGRLPNADSTKFNHSQQFVIPSSVSSHIPISCYPLLYCINRIMYNLYSLFSLSKVYVIDSFFSWND